MSYDYPQSGDFTQSDEDAIRELLLFHSVAKVDEDKLVLDDGTVLEFHPNVGGCSCGAGDYEIAALNGCENVITSVTFDRIDSEISPDSYEEPDTTYSIFVYAENKQINLLSVEGSDGNGYYGTGYWIRVSKPTAA